MSLKNLSGPIIYQIEPPAANDDHYPVGTSYLYQDFFLPDNYERGTGTGLSRIPPLTGLSLFIGVDADQARRATLDYKLERQDPTTGVWETLVSGTTIGCHSDGPEVWFDIYFDQALDILAEWYRDRHRFRFAFKGRNATPVSDQPVDYDGQYVNINGELIPARLKVGVSLPIVAGGVPSLVRQDPSGQVYYSTQGGVSYVWFSVPNPLSTSFAKATSDGTTAIQDGGQDVSFLFHVFGGIGEQGSDWLGNSYRHALVKRSVANVTTTDPSLENAYWLSKPNPSQFAVESLYFDISANNEAQVVDRILVDPITPGVFFSIYHSNEGERPTDEFGWENKLWTRTKQNFQMGRRETHALASPITAKYLKLEFTHLQAKPYAPGGYQKPIPYRKHPKWVLDYFLARAATSTNSQDPYTARRVDVSYDAFDIAYNYYLDDLNQEPLTPAQIGFDADSGLNQFLHSRDDNSDLLDSTLLSRISTDLKPFTLDPIFRAKDNFLLASPLLALSVDPGTPDPLLEGDPPSSNLSGDVASINQNAIVFEQTHPVMFFWLDCRHRYREVLAEFKHDRGYFAGVREIAFTRDHYDIAYDAPLYIESAGDLVNVERSDFATVDFGWQTYDSTASDIPIL